MYLISTPALAEQFSVQDYKTAVTISLQLHTTERGRNKMMLADDGLPVSITTYAIFAEETQIIHYGDATGQPNSIEHIVRHFHGMIFLREDRAIAECEALNKTYQELKQEGRITSNRAVRYIYRDYTAT